MSKEEVAQKLEEFQEYLSLSNVFTDILRWLGWVLVRGVAWIVDMLESVTDNILLIKNFYNNPEIIAFVDSIKPFLYILLAFSLLYTGYLLIFQKKFNREGIVINLFIALTIIMILNIGMDKANDFTDAAIDAVKVDALYPHDEASLSGSILQRNIVDLTEIDKDKWGSTEIEPPNSTPPSKVVNINVREKYGKDTEGISREGKEVSKHMLSLNNIGEYRAEKLDQSGLEWNNEYYFRYSIDWFTIFVTLGVIAFTLFSISLKLAKLFYELTFNYILALLIAPADIHDGQKMKKVIQSILNTFIATILIFLSMKVYMIGTVYLDETLDNFAYLIALIAFSLAVVDGPNIVERLFGIDAGLKSGWGVLAGAYAGGRLATGVGKGVGNMAKGLSSNQSKDNKQVQSKPNKPNNPKPPSPNDDSKKKQDNKDSIHSKRKTRNNKNGIELAGHTATSEYAKPSAEATSMVDNQALKEQQKKQQDVPSPNDIESTDSVKQPANRGAASFSQATPTASQLTKEQNPATSKRINGSKDKASNSSYHHSYEQRDSVSTVDLKSPDISEEMKSIPSRQTSQHITSNPDANPTSEVGDQTQQATLNQNHKPSHANQSRVHSTERKKRPSTYEIPNEKKLQSLKKRK